jgi:hypothetical protein
MGQPSYAAAARTLAVDIQTAPGVIGAAAELERIAVAGGHVPA